MCVICLHFPLGRGILWWGVILMSSNHRVADGMAIGYPTIL